jgi:hypothetical protein
MPGKDVPHNVEGELDEAATPVPRYIFAGCNFEIIWEGQFLDYSRVERVTRKRGVFKIKSTRPETVVRRIDLAQVQEINTYDNATVPLRMRLIIGDGKKCIQLKYNTNRIFTIKIDDAEFSTLLYWLFVSIIKHSRYYTFDQAQQIGFRNKLGNMSRQGTARQQSSLTRVNKLVTRKRLVDFELVNKTFIKAVKKFEHDNPADGGPVLPHDRKLNVIRTLESPGTYSIRGAKGYVARTGGGILAQSSIGMVQAGTLIRGLHGLVTGRNAGSPCVVKMINTAGSSDGAVNAGANTGELNAFIREARILAVLGKHENIT